MVFLKGQARTNCDTQSNPTSSSSIRSVTERSQGSESESEQKRLSRQSTKKHQLQEQSQVTQVLRKQLKAERQLILALEEAVTDLEAHVKELLSECQHWKQKSAQLQTKVDDYKGMDTALHWRLVLNKITSATAGLHKVNTGNCNSVDNCQKTLSQRMQFFNKRRNTRSGFNCI